jgi:hypothetical protein
MTREGSRTSQQQVAANIDNPLRSGLWLGRTCSGMDTKVVLLSSIWTRL